MRGVATVLMCAAVFAATASPALADGESSFGLTPLHYDPSLGASKSYFIAVARPGSTIRNSVRITNTGSATGTANLYAVDATTGQTSGAVYLDRTKPRRDVGAWIRLSASSVTLGPGQSRDVAFVVHVPHGVQAGDHLGGIVADNAAIQSSSGRGALQIKIRHLTITAVEVQVPGALGVGLKVLGVTAGGQHGYQYVYVKLRNVGTVTIKPEGTLRIASTGRDTQVSVEHLKLDSLLPGTTIAYPVLIPSRVLPAGRYTAAVRLTYGAAPLGYRRVPGSGRSVAGAFEFSVSKRQNATVYTGAAPVTRPQPAATAASGSSSGSPLIPSSTAVLLGLLAVLATSLLLFVRRWASRG